MTDITRIARQFIEAIPHSQALGMEFESLGDGRAVISMPWDARFVGDPATGVIHGGAVSALMDTGVGGCGDVPPGSPGVDRNARPANRLFPPGNAPAKDRGAGRMLPRHPLRRLRARHRHG